MERKYPLSDYALSLFSLFLPLLSSGRQITAFHGILQAGAAALEERLDFFYFIWFLSLSLPNPTQCTGRKLAHQRSSRRIEVGAFLASYD